MFSFVTEKMKPNVEVKVISLEPPANDSTLQLDLQKLADRATPVGLLNGVRASKKM